MSDRPTTSAEVFEQANAARDAQAGVGIVHDPFPRYHELRAQCPVHEGTLTEKFGFAGLDGALMPDRRHVVSFGYSSVEAILKDTDTFSSAWYGAQLETSVGRSILQMDPPEHQRHRLVVQGAFSQANMAVWRTRYVEGACDHYIDQFVARGRADLYQEFCVKLPVHVIALALGLPTDDLPWFHLHAVRLTAGGTSPDEGRESVAAIESVLRPLIARRRAEPGDDLISHLVRGSVTDEHGMQHELDDEEALTFCKLLLPAGANTTYRALGLLLVTLFQHPEVLDAVRADPSRTEGVVEELLRLEHTTSLIGRICTRDTELDGVPVHAGDVVLTSLAAANHDPARWEDPDLFDPSRRQIANLAFGWGRHRCLGVHLARMELVTALEKLLVRLPGLRADPAAPPSTITGLLFRAPDHVRAVWDAPVAEAR